MVVEEKALELTALIYDAALAPEKWSSFMARLAHELRAYSSMLRVANHNSGNVSMFETVNYDPQQVTAYREHFIHLDYFATAFTTLPIGTMITGDEVVPWELQRNTEFYNGYLRAGNVRHVIGGTLFRSNNYHMEFGLQRELGEKDFDENDKWLLNLLSPHMVRAAYINHQIGNVTLQKQWALSALNQLHIGIILLDDQSKVLFINGVAEQLISGSNGLSIGEYGPVLSNSADTAHLRSIIRDAAKLASGRGNISLFAGGSMRVAAGECGRRMQLQIIPLPLGLSERPFEGLPTGCVAVFVSLEGVLHLSRALMADRYGLTCAEARLASMMAEGNSLEDIAESLAVSIQTARSQLKSVFAKTGVRRQAELVALVLTDYLVSQPINDSSKLNIW